MTLLPGHESSRSAVLSPCGRYRYVLRRSVLPAGKGTVLFVMLNPSVADCTIDDPTVRRCIAYAGAWGFAELAIVNLFAFRSTDPRGLLGAADPIGPDNDAHLLREACAADLVVCGWGARGGMLDRDQVVLGMLRAAGVATHCLARTAEGQPGHPLFLSADRRPVAMEVEPR